MENEVRMFLKMVLMSEYSPKEIIIDINSKTATITVQSIKVLEDIMNKFTEMVNIRNPEYILWKSQPNMLPENNPLFIQK
jgi:hypothetical protein